MNLWEVTAVYDNSFSISINHATKESAVETINVIKHNAQVRNEKVTITKEWEK